MENVARLNIHNIRSVFVLGIIGFRATSMICALVQWCSKEYSKYVNSSIGDTEYNVQLPLYWCACVFRFWIWQCCQMMLRTAKDNFIWWFPCSATLPDAYLMTLWFRCSATLPAAYLMTLFNYVACNYRMLLGELRVAEKIPGSWYNRKDILRPTQSDRHIAPRSMSHGLYCIFQICDLYFVALCHGLTCELKP